MLLLTSHLTLTSQVLNLSVLTCQMGTMALTSRMNLRGTNENMHTGCLAIRAHEKCIEKMGCCCCCYYSPVAAPTYQGMMAAEDSSFSTWGTVNIRPHGGFH